MGPSGRNALVTGVSRRAGIGFAIAHRLVDAGVAVFVQGWTEHDAAQPWGSEPGGTEAVAGELGVPFAEVNFADPEAPEHLVAAAADAVGPLDILVVNHARSGDGRLADLSAGEIDAFLAENVRAVVCASPIDIGGTSLPITLSAGVACHPQHGTSIHTLTGAADAALYAAKGAGKNQVRPAVTER